MVARFAKSWKWIWKEHPTDTLPWIDMIVLLLLLFLIPFDAGCYNSSQLAVGMKAAAASLPIANKLPLERPEAKRSKWHIRRNSLLCIQDQKNQRDKPRHIVVELIGDPNPNLPSLSHNYWQRNLYTRNTTHRHQNDHSKTKFVFFCAALPGCFISQEWLFQHAICILRCCTRLRQNIHRRLSKLRTQLFTHRWRRAS